MSKPFVDLKKRGNNLTTYKQRKRSTTFCIYMRSITNS